MSQMRTIMVPPLELSVAVTSARPKIFITVQKTLDGLYAVVYFTDLRSNLRITLYTQAVVAMFTTHVTSEVSGHV